MKRFFIAATLGFLLTGCATPSVLETPRFITHAEAPGTNQAEIHGRSLEFLQQPLRTVHFTVKYADESRGRIIAMGTTNFTQKAALLDSITHPVHFSVVVDSTDGLGRMSIGTGIFIGEQHQKETRRDFHDKFNLLLQDYKHYVETGGEWSKHADW